MEMRENSSDSEEKVQIKKEPREEDIKGYAEHTMNELLAIYGYEKVEEGMTKELRLHHFSDKDDEQEAEASNGNLVIKQDVEDEGTYGLQPQISEDQINDCHIAGHHPGDATCTSQVDNHLNSSSEVLTSACTSSEPCGGNNRPHPKYDIVCAWCQNFGFKRYTLNTATESKAFCSEKCFAACRRAYFRRNKVCDWCRHIRHTKGYIDFQDGERKLQFCSEKCLHQYKMEVFCQETQALGSSGQPPVDSGAVTEPTGRGNEQLVSGASSSDETEQGDGMLLSVSADSSTQSFVVGNGIHHLTAKQGNDWPVLAARTQPKAKQHPNRTVIGVHHVPIAPKVTASNVQLQTAAKVVITQSVVSPSVTPPSVTPPNALPPRINPANTSQVFGLQTAILQPGIGGTQVVGRTPVVVRGTHWPPVVRQIPGYVIPNQQPQLLQQQPSPPIIQPQRRILPAVSAKNQSEVTSEPKKAVEITCHAQTSCPPETKATGSNQSSTPSLNQLLPPVTVMVPQPVFIPVPYPIPIPVPVPEETFHAMRDALAERSTSHQDVNLSVSTQGNNPIGTPSQHFYDSSNSQDFKIGRNLSSAFQESAFHKTDSEQVLGSPFRTSIKRHNAGSSHHKDSVKYSKKELAICLDSRHTTWQPFIKYNTLQRSSSMDLSLARSCEDNTCKAVQKASQLDPDTNIRGHVSGQQNTYLTPDDAVHLSGESSAKVREALRCHLTRRLSQSALNLTEVGRIPNAQDDLRRCQSLSRLRSLEPNHMEKLPELTDGCSSRRIDPLENADFKEDMDEEENLVISLEDDPQPEEVESDDDSTEPERKRKCLNEVHL